MYNRLIFKVWNFQDFKENIHILVEIYQDEIIYYPLPPPFSPIYFKQAPIFPNLSIENVDSQLVVMWHGHVTPSHMYVCFIFKTPKFCRFEPKHTYFGENIKMSSFLIFSSHLYTSNKCQYLQIWALKTLSRFWPSCDTAMWPQHTCTITLSLKLCNFADLKQNKHILLKI